LPIFHNFFQDSRSDRILDRNKKALLGQIHLTGGALNGSGAKKPIVRGPFDPHQTFEIEEESMPLMQN